MVDSVPSGTPGWFLKRRQTTKKDHAMKTTFLNAARAAKAAGFAFLATLALLAPATVRADAVNIRSWLAGKGVTVSDCVSGDGYHSDAYGPAILFDGVSAVDNATDAKANRWLARKGKSSTAQVTITAPDELFASENDGLALVRFRLYRYSSLSDSYAVKRAPATWTLYGSMDGTTWEPIHELTEDNYIRWDSATEYVEFEIPQESRIAYRAFKFQPLKSFMEIDTPTALVDWYNGAMELELYVEEVSRKPLLNLRELLVSAGVTVADCVTGEGHYANNPNDYNGPDLLFDGVKETTATAGTRWLAGQNNLDGVSVTFTIPRAARGNGVVGHILKGYAIYRNINGNTGRQRAPKTWKIQGSDDGVQWTDIDTRSEAVAWGSDDSITSMSFNLPENKTSYRQLRFVPLSSSYTWGNWRVGLQEIEYFVEEDITFQGTCVFFR